jgi:hypothetical protein
MLYSNNLQQIFSAIFQGRKVYKGNLYDLIENSPEYDKPLDCYRLRHYKKWNSYGIRNTCLWCTKVKVCKKDKITYRGLNGSLSKRSKYIYYNNSREKQIKYREKNHFLFKGKVYPVSTFSHPEALKIMIEIKKIVTDHYKLLKEANGKRCIICWRDLDLSMYSNNYTYCKKCHSQTRKNKRLEKIK